MLRQYGRQRQEARAPRCAFAERLDPELGRWIAGEARFPDTMVDSITPATDDALRRRGARRDRLRRCDPGRARGFAAWVIEDMLPPGGPDLAARRRDRDRRRRARYERAKLRMLNGAHSTLAYLGLLRGHETVAEAMADPGWRRFVER